MECTVRLKARCARGLALVLLFVTAVAAGPPTARAAAGGKASGGAFEVEWFVVEAGGGPLAGAAFQGVGGVGSPAAAATMAGGAFEVAGGYLPAGSAVPAGSHVFGDGFEGGAD